MKFLGRSTWSRSVKSPSPFRVFFYQHQMYIEFGNKEQVLGMDRKFGGVATARVGLEPTGGGGRGRRRGPRGRGSGPGSFSIPQARPTATQAGCVVSFPRPGGGEGSVGVRGITDLKKKSGGVPAAEADIARR